MITRIEQKSTTACTTEYAVTDDVHGVLNLRLWVIVGGTLALGFSDHSIHQRYPKVEKFESDQPWRGYYPHQDPLKPQGPTPDDLPGGIASVQEFIDLNAPKVTLRNERTALLPAFVSSHRLHDVVGHQYFHVVWENRPNYVSRPVATSGRFWGTPDGALLAYIPEEWRNLIAEEKVLSERHGATLVWEDLTQEEFDSFRALLAAL